MFKKGFYSIIYVIEVNNYLKLFKKRQFIYGIKLDQFEHKKKKKN